MGGVVYLDVDDEITSAVARIRAATPGPVVLVVPYGSRLASSRINFRLLAREAATFQRDLTVVASEPATRALAASAGLATHATVLEYESVAARSASIAPPPAVAAAEAVDSQAAARGASIRGGGPARGPQDSAGQPAAGAATAEARVPAAEARVSAPAAPSPDVLIVPPGDPGHYLRGPLSPAPIPMVGPPRRGLVTRSRIVAGLVVAALVIALAGIASVALLPSAEITLTPVPEVVGPLALSVTADPAAAAPDADRRVIPATRASVPVEVTGQFTATGKELIEQKATGAVTFQNCDTGDAHTFPAGTQVRTADGTVFTTALAVTLARARINPAFACTAANVSVTAVKAGPEANVVAGTITLLPSGYDAVILTVVNRTATSGGTRTELIRVTKTDVDAALAQLRARLNEAFAAKLAEPGITPAGSTIVAQSQRLGDASPASDPNALVGLQQTTFDLGLRATGTVLTVNSGPVAGIAEARLAASLPAGYRLVPGSVRATVDPPALSGEVATIAVRIRAERVRDIDIPALLAAIRGKSIAAARTVLEPYGQVRITVWPDWVTAIPGSESRVRLTVAAGAGGTAAPSPSAARPSAVSGPSTTPPASAPPAASVRPSTAPTPARTATPAPTPTVRKP